MSMCGRRRVPSFRHAFVVQAKLGEAQVDALVAKLTEMVAKADAKYEVTLPMLKRSARCKASSMKLFARVYVTTHVKFVGLCD